MPLLTIAIPTFNRAVHLKRLLDALLPMTSGLDDQIEIIVSDNASADDTPLVIADACRERPDIRAVRNDTNIGADRNLASCFRSARGKYVWIVGDDDIPKTGLLPALIDLLREEEPDLVYVPSEWLPDVFHPDQGRAFDPTRRAWLERQDFAAYVNIWITFVSGIIVRRAHAEHRADIDSFYDSLLIHMSWLLPALREGNKFFVFGNEGVLATSANTGGYGVLKVFGTVFPELIAREFGVGSAVYRAMVSRTVSGYLPNLIWGIRTGTLGRFDMELPWALLRRTIGRFPAFWLLVVPAGRAPIPLAKLVVGIARNLATIRRVVDRKLRYRL